GLKPILLYGENNDYSLVYTVENNQLGLYKLTDLQQKDNLAAANPQVVKEMQGVVREFIDNSQPPLSEVNQEKFNNIKKALSEAKTLNLYAADFSAALFSEIAMHVTA
ncbi:hypothetical protein, partial [Pseudomonas aeruginosa]|uniref:hypothetical protein n=1 Tax=Pseudomonas aeruginosa TaxID=287 RepID=UPI0031B75707